MPFSTLVTPHSPLSPALRHMPKPPVSPLFLAPKRDENRSLFALTCRKGLGARLARVKPLAPAFLRCRPVVQCDHEQSRNRQPQRHLPLLPGQTGGGS